MDAKEKRIIEFTETKKLCETDAELINAIEQSKNMQKIAKNNSFQRKIVKKLTKKKVKLLRYFFSKNLEKIY